MAEILDREMTDEELEEARRRRIEALSAPTRLAPVGESRPEIPERRSTSAAAPDLERSRLQPIGGSELSPVGSTSDMASDSSLVRGRDRLQPLGYRDRQRLPTISAGAPAGSAASYQSEIAGIEDEKAHPWGSPDNHPGRLGRLGHVLSRIGNIAGNVVSPLTMAAVPGTDANRQVRENRATHNLDDAEVREEAGRHNRAEEDIAGRRIDATDEQKRNELAVKLRKYGLSVDQEGKTVPVSYEQMSPTEQAAYDLKQSQGDAAEARALLDHMKANPNSPQNAAIQERLRIMAKNAATAAGKLGLDGKKFVADYYGTDENGTPLAGVTTTPEGTPVGPKIAGANQRALSEFNKNYVKPSEDVEKSYQMFQEAYKNRNDAKTGAESMLALSTHLATTFGVVKGARVTKDMIEHHLGARGITDRMVVAVQSLINGDVLSPDQWDAFNHLISNSRKLSWQTAVKEGKRANQSINFLPADLQKELGGEAAPKASGGGSTPTRPAGVPKEAIFDEGKRQWRLPTKP